MKVVGKWMDLETIVLTATNPDPEEQMLQVFVHKWMLALSLFRDTCFSCSALQSWAATKAPWRGI